MRHCLHARQTHRLTPAWRGGEGATRNANQSRRGFTLIELIAVIVVVGLVAAMALPQFLTIIAFSELEGTARHMAGYGRAAMAHATMLRHEIIVNVDLEYQEYYITQKIYPDALEGTEGEVDMVGMDSDQFEILTEIQRSGISQDELNERMLTGNLDDLPENFNPEALDLQMNDAFTQYAQKGLRARAKNVIHEEGLLDGIGDFFSNESIFVDDMEPIEEELFDPVLGRTTIQRGVILESITLNCKNIRSGLAQIPIGPLGLNDEIRFFLYNEETEEYFTVIWDPLSGGSNVIEGYETGDCS